MATSAGTAKTLDKTRTLIESGSHYEAQQMLKTVYHRHRARKQLQDSYIILKEGAIMQLQQSQITCAVELALMLVEAYTQDKTSVDLGLPAVLDILSNLPNPATPSAEASASGQDTWLDEEARVVAAAGKWATKRGQPEAARQVNDAFAWHIWKAYGWRQMGRATRYFVRGRDAKHFAEALHSCASEAPASEADLFVCRATMQVLAAATGPASADRQLSYAQQLFEECRRLSPSLATPLAHFVQLMLPALARKSKTLAALLKQQYQPSLNRDPVMGAYLTQVERVYLGVGGAAGGMGGLFAGLLKSLTAADGDEDDSGDDVDE